MPPTEPHHSRHEPQFSAEAPIYPEGLALPESGPVRHPGGSGTLYALCLGTLMAGLIAGSLWVVQPLQVELAHKDAQWAAANQRIAALEQLLAATPVAVAPHVDSPPAPESRAPAQDTPSAQAAQRLRGRLTQALDALIGQALVAVHQDELAVVLRVPADVAASARLPEILRLVAAELTATPDALAQLGLEVQLQGTAPKRRRGRDVFAARLTALVRAVDATFHHGPDDLHWHVALGEPEGPWGSLALTLGPRQGDR